MNVIAKDDHAKQNAAAWVSSLSEMVAALNCDYDRLEELLDMEADSDTIFDQDEADELAALKLACTIDGQIMKDADEARERIQESPLSVQVRGGWYSPGGDGDIGQAEEFEILLTTGGPALRIRGELDRNEPCRAWLEYQDWGTGWQQYFDVEQDTLLEYCRVFYFGE